MRVKRSQLKPVFGTTQEQRFPGALDPASARLDERTQADRLAFAVSFASLLQFYDLTNQPAGDWSTFFERDASFLLAQIVSANFSREQFESWALYNGVRRGENRTAEALDNIAKLVRRMDDWYRRARDIANKDIIAKNDFQENHLKKTLQSIIEKDLAPHFQNDFLRALAALDQLHPNTDGISWTKYWQGRTQHLSEVWSMPAAVEAETASPYAVQPASPPVNDADADQLLSTLYALHRANFRLRDVAAQYLQQSLEDDSSHSPHSALYIAFTGMLELFRDKINTVTDRHLDFYYREVLRLKERDPAPDVAHVCFTIAPQIPKFLLPAGTRLAAGKTAQGSLREFATDTDLFINHARVASLRALYLCRDRYAASDETRSRAVSVLALPCADSADGLGKPLQDPSTGWPTFGIDETASTDIDKAALQAQLGFVVATPVLQLQNGERTVNVSVEFRGDNSLENALQNYQAMANRLLDVPAPAGLLLRDAFKVWLSTATGWLEVAASFRRHPVVGMALEIEFILAALAPPIVANPALAPEPRQAQWPMLKFVLNPSARVYPYEFFKDLVIDSIEFRIAVSGLDQLQIRNEFGPLSPTQPFPFFGPIPSIGSYLLLSHPEMTVKRVDHLALTIEWFNLPVPPDSLTSEYAAYDLGITDESFKMRWSVSSAGKWISPPSGRELLPMFARDFERSSGVLPVTSLGLDIPSLPLPSPMPAQPPPLLSEATAPRGTIRLELAEPACAFGQAAFPRIMADVATGNARLGRHGSLKPLPNPPIAPVAKSLTLDYEAGDTLDLARPLPENQGNFYSLFPFGHARHQDLAPTLCPDFPEQGNLYLGLTDTNPGETVTLLFQIRDASFSPIPRVSHPLEEMENPLTWRYLCGNEWKDFPTVWLLSDTTMSFTRSGIVTLTLPEDITLANTILPEGFYWIKASLKNVTDVYWCHVVSIDSQGVTAKRVCDSASELMPASLPAGTITQLVEKRAEIKTVSQPFATCSGIPRETTAKFRTRVSERTRHKDRAIQTFDYERLILEAFPQVGQAKCIGHNQSLYFPGTKPLAPGMLYMVAAPRIDEASPNEPRLPQYVLQEIEDFLRLRTSPFVKNIHIINPVYEMLKVFAQIEFSDGDFSYYFDDLNAAICSYLRPWLREPSKALYIGSGQVQGYELAKFILQQPHVKRLQSMKMLHTYQTEAGYVSRWRSGERRVWASAPWSVLVPEPQHGLTAADPAAEIDEGIGNLTVGGDFVLGKPEKKEDEKNQAVQRYFLVVPRSAILDTTGH
jgi:hypothetical protein